MLPEPEIYALWRFCVVDMKLYQKDKSVLQRIFKALQAIYKKTAIFDQTAQVPMTKETTVSLTVSYIYSII